MTKHYTERSALAFFAQRHTVLWENNHVSVHQSTPNVCLDVRDQVSESNPWIESTESVALYGSGERFTDVEKAETDEAFCELMSRVGVLAQACNDINASAKGGTFIAHANLQPACYATCTALLARLLEVLQAVVSY